MLRIIDLNGFYLRDDVAFDEITEIGLDVEFAQGLYKAVWDGEKWVEGLTQAEIDAIKSNVDTELTIEEKVTRMAEQLLATQTELEQAQQALDYIIMGGM